MDDDQKLINQGQQNIQQVSALPKRQGVLGTGYTNIQRIVGANQNNRLGSTISDRIKQDATNTNQNVNNTKKQFDDEAAKTRAGIQSNQQFTQNAVQNAGSGTSEEDAKRFQTVLQGNYQGPTGIQNIDQLQNQAFNLKQTGELTGSAGGRQALLQRYAGTPQYTQGQQNVDSLLLGQTGANQLKQARRFTGDVQNKVNALDSGSQAQIQALQNQTQNLTKNANDLLTGANTGVNTDIDSAFTNATTEDANYQALLNKFREDIQKQKGIEVNAANGDPDQAMSQLFDDTGFQGTAGTWGRDAKAPIKDDIAMMQQLKDKGILSEDQFNTLTGMINQTLGKNLTSDQYFNNARMAKKQALADLYSGYNAHLNMNGQMSPTVARYDGGGSTLSKLLMNSLKVNDAQNLNRTGTASDQQIAKLNALSKLAGGTAVIDPTRAAYKKANAAVSSDDILKRYGADEATASDYYRNIFGSGGLFPAANPVTTPEPVATDPGHYVPPHFIKPTTELTELPPGMNTEPPVARDPGIPAPPIDPHYAPDPVTGLPGGGFTVPKGMPDPRTIAVDPTLPPKTAWEVDPFYDKAKDVGKSYQASSAQNLLNNGAKYTNAYDVYHDLSNLGIDPSAYLNTINTNPNYASSKYGQVDAATKTQLTNLVNQINASKKSSLDDYRTNLAKLQPQYGNILDYQDAKLKELLTGKNYSGDASKNMVSALTSTLPSYYRNPTYDAAKEQQMYDYLYKDLAGINLMAPVATKEDPRLGGVRTLAPTPVAVNPDTVPIPQLPVNPKATPVPVKTPDPVFAAPTTNPVTTMPLPKEPAPLLTAPAPVVTVPAASTPVNMEPVATRLNRLLGSVR